MARLASPNISSLLRVPCLVQAINSQGARTNRKGNPVTQTTRRPACFATNFQPYAADSAFSSMEAGQEQDSDQSNSGIQQHDAQAISGDQQTPLVPPQPRLGPSPAVSMMISELEIWHYEIFLYWLGADPRLPIADAIALFETKTSELLQALATAANEFCRTTDRLERTAQAGQPVP